MHKDHHSYYGFTGRSRLDKAINTLVGIIEGIAADSVINNQEIDFLNMWLGEHRQYQDKHPFNELIPVLDRALSDGVLTDEENQDILWLCKKIQSTEFYDATTSDIQRLHAILGGIMADGVISKTELQGLSDWISEHEHLKTCWPYDEVDSLITSVLSDGIIDDDEHKQLLEFFSEFTALLDDRTITSPRITTETTIVGLCSVCPEIEFSGSTFCFTGASYKYPRSRFSELVNSLGGSVASAVSSKVNYLIIGAEGNPCWAYACYGRKVEKAVELRKKGSNLLLVHENDFHDAVADAGVR